MKDFPDGWRQVLNSAKDIVRSSILLTEPFPGPVRARICVSECFHEAVINECEGGTNLEEGTFHFIEILSPLTILHILLNRYFMVSPSDGYCTLSPNPNFKQPHSQRSLPQLLNEISTCRSELKKFSKTLVADDQQSLRKDLNFP